MTCTTSFIAAGTSGASSPASYPRVHPVPDSDRRTRRPQRRTVPAVGFRRRPGPGLRAAFHQHVSREREIFAAAFNAEAAARFAGIKIDGCSNRPCRSWSPTMRGAAGPTCWAGTRSPTRVPTRSAWPSRISGWRRPPRGSVSAGSPSTGRFSAGVAGDSGRHPARGVALPRPRQPIAAGARPGTTRLAQPSAAGCCPA